MHVRFSEERELSGSTLARPVCPTNCSSQQFSHHNTVDARIPPAGSLAPADAIANIGDHADVVAVVVVVDGVGRGSGSGEAEGGTAIMAAAAVVVPARGGARERAGGTEAVDVALGRRVPRAPVVEAAARVEPLPRPARHPDLQPVVPAAPRAVVDRLAHWFCGVCLL